MRRHLEILSLALCLSLAASFASAAEPDKNEKRDKIKGRLEQLFVWRVSDRLALNPQQEQEFSLQFHKISEERTQLGQKLDSILDDIEKEKENPTKQAKLLSDYESTLKKYNGVQTKEMETMKHMFSTKKMVDYVLLKREMTQKFKDVLSQQNQGSSTKGAEKAPLKEPEVIQEK